MKLYWTQFNHKIDFKYGTALKGIIYKDIRPNKITLKISELNKSISFIDYLTNCLKPAIKAREITIE